jgi:hypothetical protein
VPMIYKDKSHSACYMYLNLRSCLLVKMLGPHDLDILFLEMDRLTDPEVRVLFSALQDFQRCGGSGTRSTQPREYN